MGYIISFLIGGWCGFLMAALMVAGRRDDNDQ